MQDDPDFLLNGFFRSSSPFTTLAPNEQRIQCKKALAALHGIYGLPMPDFTRRPEVSEAQEDFISWVREVAAFGPLDPNMRALFDMLGRDYLGVSLLDSLGTEVSPSYSESRGC